MLIKIHTIHNINLTPEIIIKIKENIKIIIKFSKLQQLENLLKKLEYIQITNSKIIICNTPKFITKSQLKNKILKVLKSPVKVNLTGIAKLLYNHLDKYNTSDFKQLIKQLSPVELSDTDALEIIKIIAK